MDRRKTLVARRHAATGFTLIELMLVVVVMILLLGISGDFFSNTMRSQQLAATARLLAADLDHAVLLAQKENRPVEVRFLRYALPGSLGKTGPEASMNNQIRAYQFAVLTGFDAANKPEYRVLSEVNRFPQGIVAMPGGEYSSLTLLPTRSPGLKDTRIGPTYTFVAYQINPDGTTTLPHNPRPVITLVEEERLKANKLPPNYRSVTIDPDNGQTRLY
jgi:uncharacterized protein (TIGR02596 family)